MRLGAHLHFIAGVVAAGAARPAVFQRPRRGDLLPSQRYGLSGQMRSRQGKAVNHPYHRAAFKINDKVFNPRP